MSTEALLLDAALRTWNTNLDRASKLFGDLSEEQLQQEIAPGKNRLIYLWGHLTAVNDALLPLWGFGPRLHPELDEVFIKNPDRTKQTPPTAELKQKWQHINDTLHHAMSKLTPAEWADRHTAVSAEDFQGEPHRNRFNVLLSRTNHLAYHLGQAISRA